MSKYICFLYKNIFSVEKDKLTVINLVDLQS